ncbi:hypothetical protein Lbir_0567 [Legionella birminghamensis]|uniref:Uncharacterized protein n=1 Tax=Legionella birminghamensis TaxID=28083 RepID=A0A378IAH5_9GAMM|nr:hypothetical protein [Legionella birminghamensis]KTC75193.1 hypothetical protein Lbir_0567 [Legionella birminghamensis]STX31856.1 Uncharacterised protein [Legionella birminghamensis]
MNKKMIHGRMLILYVICSLFVFDTAFSENEKESPKWILTPQSLGPIKIGMTLTEAEQATHKAFLNSKPEEDVGEDETCFNTSLQGLEDISFMISKQKIVRININGGTIKTNKGAGIGDTENNVMSLYKNKLITEPHRYDNKGHYLTFIKHKEPFAIRFETDGQKVVRMYAGQTREVHFVEDCL